MLAVAVIYEASFEIGAAFAVSDYDEAYRVAERMIKANLGKGPRKYQKSMRKEIEKYNYYCHNNGNGSSWAVQIIEVEET